MCVYVCVYMCVCVCALSQKTRAAIAVPADLAADGTEDAAAAVANALHISGKNRLESSVCQSGPLAPRHALSIRFTKYVKGPDNGD